VFPVFISAIAQPASGQSHYLSDTILSSQTGHQIFKCGNITSSWL